MGSSTIAESRANNSTTVRATVTLTTSNTSNNYRGSTTMLTITDDDTARVTINPTSVTLQEDLNAGSGTNQRKRTYTVVFDTALEADRIVGVGVTSSDRGAVEVDTANDPLTGVNPN